MRELLNLLQSMFFFALLEVRTGDAPGSQTITSLWGKTDFVTSQPKESEKELEEVSFCPSGQNY